MIIIMFVTHTEKDEIGQGKRFLFTLPNLVKNNQTISSSERQSFQIITLLKETDKHIPLLKFVHASFLKWFFLK